MYRRQRIYKHGPIFSIARTLLAVRTMFVFVCAVTACIASSLFHTLFLLPLSTGNLWMVDHIAGRQGVLVPGTSYAVWHGTIRLSGIGVWGSGQAWS